MAEFESFGKGEGDGGGSEGWFEVTKGRNSRVIALSESRYVCA